ncbi:hypothetical protein CABS03_11177 [Colletotrichum abscissum]
MDNITCTLNTNQNASSKDTVELTFHLIELRLSTLQWNYSYRVPLVYLRPVSQATVTTTLPGPSSLAKDRAPTTLSPVEVPVKSPSSFASLRHMARASSSGYARASSYKVSSSNGGTNPGLIPTHTFKHLCNSHHHASAANGTAEGINSLWKLLDQFVSKSLVTRHTVLVLELVCGVVPLVFFDDCLRLLDHRRKQIWRNLSGGTVDDIDKSPESSHRAQFLFGEDIRADGMEPVPLQGAYKGQRRPRATAGGFDYSRAWLQVSSALCLFNYGSGQAIFVGARGVERLKLQIHVGATFRYNTTQSYAWCVADGI